MSVKLFETSMTNMGEISSQRLSMYKPKTSKKMQGGTL